MTAAVPRNCARPGQFLRFLFLSFGHVSVFKFISRLFIIYVSNAPERVNKPGAHLATALSDLKNWSTHEETTTFEHECEGLSVLGRTLQAPVYSSNVCSRILNNAIIAFCNCISPTLGRSFRPGLAARTKYFLTGQLDTGKMFALSSRRQRPKTCCVIPPNCQDRFKGSPPGNECKSVYSVRLFRNPTGLPSGCEGIKRAKELLQFGPHNGPIPTISPRGRRRQSSPRPRYRRSSRTRR